MHKTSQLHQRRKQRIRTKLKKVSSGLPRLCVHRTNQHTYAQIIDDVKAISVAYACTNGKAGSALKNGANVEAAKFVGKQIAELAQKNGVTAVTFDRSGYIYHGRIKALADAAREAGLKF